MLYMLFTYIHVRLHMFMYIHIIFICFVIFNGSYFSVSWRSLGSAGTRGAYGLNVLRHLQGQHGTRLQEIRKVPGANKWIKVADWYYVHATFFKRTYQKKTFDVHKHGHNYMLIYTSKMVRLAIKRLTKITQTWSPYGGFFAKSCTRWKKMWLILVDPIIHRVSTKNVLLVKIGLGQFGIPSIIICVSLQAGHSRSWTYV